MKFNSKRCTLRGFSPLFAMLLLCVVALTGCRNENGKQRDDSSAMRYAKMLRLEEHDGYTVAEVMSVDRKKVDKRYILVENEKEVPGDLPEGTVLHTPLKNAVVYSDVYAGVLDELGNVEMIKGVADADYFKTPSVVEGLKSGKVKNIGMASAPSLELLTSLKSDGVLISVYEGMDVKGIDKAGSPIIHLADNLEETPLGRAEWIRFLGLLAGKKHEADSIFKAVESRYVALRDYSLKQVHNTRKPKVLVESMYQGVWYVPAGKSYQSNLLRDAGADYPWNGQGDNGSLSLTFEEVLAKASDADIWLIKVYGYDLDRDRLLSQDSRYKHFRPVDTGNIYYSDTSSSGLFESTPFHPERLLEEYINIFQGKGNLRYFKKMK